MVSCLYGIGRRSPQYDALDPCPGSDSTVGTGGRSVRDSQRGAKCRTVHGRTTTTTAAATKAAAAITATAAR